ncbi:hypothetical protein EG347_01895 [Chryseobacterium sp. G0186]|uniref:hypothetical protein n=1 Tax=Chryseobacterium sp. G0186 TaxID=2487064 RepID=UPI000F4EEF4F|nr:hypothetical protein [Chryseobacterium sp. G0186]AZA76365.1 hypothetical protein EG347_01895 [Chryseobacterium sp. G0186]
MLRKLLLSSVVLILFTHCKKENPNNQPTTQTTIKQNNTTPSIQKHQDHSQVETVKTFLKWYKENEDKIYSFNGIQGGALKETDPVINYYVDFDEVKKEMKFLESSALFSQEFLSDYQKRYVEGNEYFKKNPANDGPPFGFDYDYFFMTQDDYQSDLKNIDAIEFTVKPINEQSCYVEFHLKNCGMTYRYTLTKNGKWKIDSIKNIS